MILALLWKILRHAEDCPLHKEKKDSPQSANSLGTDRNSSDQLTNNKSESKEEVQDDPKMRRMTRTPSLNSTKAVRNDMKPDSYEDSRGSFLSERSDSGLTSSNSSQNLDELNRPRPSKMASDSSIDKQMEKKEKPVEKRELIAREILTTEESYGRNLEDLCDMFLEKLKEVASENEIKNIFSNVQNLRNFSKLETGKKEAQVLD